VRAAASAVVALSGSDVNLTQADLSCCACSDPCSAGCLLALRFMRLLFLLVCGVWSALSSQHHHAACPVESAWRTGIPVVACHRDPPCIEETWITVERCKGLRLDTAWPTYDPYIPRAHGWATARRMMHDQLRGKTLLLVGDSITRNVWNGFACELARLGLELDTGHPRVGALRRASRALNESAGWHPINDLYYIPEADALVGWKGWGRPNAYDTACMMQLADVLVVNYGLHYGTLNDYERDMRQLFASLSAFNAQPGKMAVFRETSSQAFFGTSAYVKDAHKTTSNCAPIAEEVAHNNHVWSQNVLVHQMALAADVPVLPFYNLTVPRWNMRLERLCQVPAMMNESDPEAACNHGACTSACDVDCSHLCATPTLWARLTSDLSAVLAVKFPLSMSEHEA